LLAETRNSRPNEIAVIAATRHADESSTRSATSVVKPRIKVMRSVIAKHSTIVSIRSGLLTKNATYAVSAGEGVW
jgi:hypothetical protein